MQLSWIHLRTNVRDQAARQSHQAVDAQASVELDQFVWLRLGGTIFELVGPLRDRLLRGQGEEEIGARDT